MEEAVNKMLHEKFKRKHSESLDIGKSVKHKRQQDEPGEPVILQN